MRKPKFNESTFQLLFLHELMSDYGATRMLVPTLYAEAGVGFDTSFLSRSGASMFLQFKLATWYEKRRRRDLPREFVPYFSFDVLNVQQHRVLRELSRSSPSTYYVAPEYVEEETLYRLSESHSMCSRAAAVPVAATRRVTDSTHRVLFWPDRGLFRFRSEPEPTMSYARFDSALESALGQPPTSLREQVSAIGLVLARSAREALSSQSPGDDALRSTYVRIARRLRRLGIHWVVLAY